MSVNFYSSTSYIRAEYSAAHHNRVPITPRPSGAVAVAARDKKARHVLDRRAHRQVEGLTRMCAVPCEIQYVHMHLHRARGKTAMRTGAIQESAAAVGIKRSERTRHRRVLLLGFHDKSSLGSKRIYSRLRPFGGSEKIGLHLLVLLAELRRRDEAVRGQECDDGASSMDRWSIFSLPLLV